MATSVHPTCADAVGTLTDVDASDRRALIDQGVVHVKIDDVAYAFFLSPVLQDVWHGVRMTPDDRGLHRKVVPLRRGASCPA